MEAVNGVSDGGGPPPPSPLTGCYLLIVIGEPHSQEHKNIILQRIAKGLLSWDVNNCLIDLEKELAIITEQAPEGEEARYGERLIQYASENLVTEVLIHPAVSTLAQCVRNLLSSFTRHRHIIHAGYTFAANGSWILQDGTFSYTDFAEAFHEIEVQRVIRAYENSISVDLHCSSEGDWTRLPKETFAKNCKVRVNPVDVLTSGSPSITNFLNYISPFLVPVDVETLLECSDVVGNIRFSHPTLYIFPGGQGDAALFGINGFNMLLDGGFSRKACFWDFVRHLDRLDAVLLTRLNNGNVCGISAVLRRKMQNAVYPQIGHFFCNIQDRKSILSPDGDKDKDPLLINLLDEGQELITNLRKLNLVPQTCYRDSEPINLYHKVGHGTLDMYVLSPTRDSKEVKDFLHRWNTNDQKLFANQKNIKDFQFPLQNMVSICALLIWQPANPNDNITRILYPGSTPQHKIFEGLDRLKNLEYIKYPVCSESKLITSSSIMALKSKQLKDASLEKLLQPETKKIEKIRDKPPKSGEIKSKLENKLVDNLEKLEMTNGISSENEIEKTVKKSDSTDSDKSVKSTKPRKTDDKGEDKRTKPESKAKESKAKPKVDSKVEKKRVLSEKKASPTTPKKTLDAKVNGEMKEREKPISKPIKYSPSSTPAKSAKEATNRKVIESKNKMTTKKEPKLSTEKKDTKPERKPISRRSKGSSPTTKTVSSPIKKANGVQKPDIIKKSKLDKEGTTDSSTVSTPSADQKDLTKLTVEEIEQLKAQELADLKEEQEVVKEIEAVFRKGEIEKDSDAALRKVKDISIEDKSEPEEYLIIEKEEVEHDSLDDKDTKEDETKKHTRDSEESEKVRKLSDDIKISLKEKEELRKQESEEAITDLKNKDDKEKPVESSKEMSVTSPEDKIDTSLDKKTVEIDNQEQNVALESQPDERYSATVESGATTAPTLPEDERITLDEIKEDNGDQAIEEKHVKEDTKEKDVPVIQLPTKTFETMSKLPPVVGIRLDKQSHIRDIVKTPDEVADLPVHEEADIGDYHMDVMKSGMKGEDMKMEMKPQEKVEADVKEEKDKDTTIKDGEEEADGESKDEREEEKVVDAKKIVDSTPKIQTTENIIPATEDQKPPSTKDTEATFEAKELETKQIDGEKLEELKVQEVKVVEKRDETKEKDVQQEKPQESELVMAEKVDQAKADTVAKKTVDIKPEVEEDISHAEKVEKAQVTEPEEEVRITEDIKEKKVESTKDDQKKTIEDIKAASQEEVKKVTEVTESITATKDKAPEIIQSVPKEKIESLENIKKEHDTIKPQAEIIEEKVTSQEKPETIQPEKTIGVELTEAKKAKEDLEPTKPLLEERVEDTEDTEKEHDKIKVQSEIIDEKEITSQDKHETIQTMKVEDVEVTKSLTPTEEKDTEPTKSVVEDTIEGAEDTKKEHDTIKVQSEIIEKTEVTSKEKHETIQPEIIKEVTETTKVKEEKGFEEIKPALDEKVESMRDIEKEHDTTKVESETIEKGKVTSQEKAETIQAEEIKVEVTETTKVKEEKDLEEIKPALDEKVESMRDIEKEHDTTKVESVTIEKEKVTSQEKPETIQAEDIKVEVTETPKVKDEKDLEEIKPAVDEKVERMRDIEKKYDTTKVVSETIEKEKVTSQEKPEAIQAEEMKEVEVTETITVKEEKDLEEIKPALGEKVESMRDIEKEHDTIKVESEIIEKVTSQEKPETIQPEKIKQIEISETIKAKKEEDVEPAKHVLEEKVESMGEHDTIKVDSEVIKGEKVTSQEKLETIQPDKNKEIGVGLTQTMDKVQDSDQKKIEDTKISQEDGIKEIDTKISQDKVEELKVISTSNVDDSKVAETDKLKEKVIKDKKEVVEVLSHKKLEEVTAIQPDKVHVCQEEKEKVEAAIEEQIMEEVIKEDKVDKTKTEDVKKAIVKSERDILDEIKIKDVKETVTENIKGDTIAEEKEDITLANKTEEEKFAKIEPAAREKEVTQIEKVEELKPKQVGKADETKPISTEKEVDRKKQEEVVGARALESSSTTTEKLVPADTMRAREKSESIVDEPITDKDVEEETAEEKIDEPMQKSQEALAIEQVPHSQISTVPSTDMPYDASKKDTGDDAKVLEADQKDIVHIISEKKVDEKISEAAVKGAVSIEHRKVITDIQEKDAMEPKGIAASGEVVSEIVIEPKLRQTEETTKANLAETSPRDKEDIKVEEIKEEKKKPTTPETKEILTAAAAKEETAESKISCQVSTQKEFPISQTLNESIDLTKEYQDKKHSLEEEIVSKEEKLMTIDQIPVSQVPPGKDLKQEIEECILDNEAKLSQIKQVDFDDTSESRDVTFYIGDQKLEKTKTDQKDEKPESKEQEKSKLDEKDTDDKQKQTDELDSDTPRKVEEKSGEKNAEELYESVEVHHEPEVISQKKTETKEVTEVTEVKKTVKEDQIDKSHITLHEETEVENTNAPGTSFEAMYDSNKYANGVQDRIEAIQKPIVTEKGLVEDEKGTKEIAEQKVKEEKADERMLNKDKEDDIKIVNGESPKDTENDQIDEEIHKETKEASESDRLHTTKAITKDQEQQILESKPSIPVIDATATVSDTDSNKEASTGKVLDKDGVFLKEAHVDETKSGSQTESPETSSEQALQTFKENEILDKVELGRKSPKEREQDVAKIVASVAEVLKSDAPLEEFEGKIPLTITPPFVPFTATYTTELRETHITTVESPISELPKAFAESKPESELVLKESKENEESEVEPKESKISSLIRDSKELMEATSKIISGIKSKTDETKSDTDTGTVHRMLVTASSEDGGEEIEICPKGTITFSKSSESSGRSSPDLSTQKLKQEDDNKMSSGKSTPDIKITAEHEKAELESTEKECLDDAKDSGKSTPKSGKMSPEIREQSPTTDSGIIEVTKPDLPTSGKSTPDIRSGKSTPDVKEKGVSIETEKKSSDSGRSTPDTVSTKIDTLAKPVATTAFDSGRSSPDSKSIEEIKQLEKPENEKTTVDEADQVFEEHKSLTTSDKLSEKSFSVEHKHDAITEDSRTSITEVSEPLSSTSESKEISSDTSGNEKREQDVDDIEQKKTLDFEKQILGGLTDASGKSTPDITQSVISGKSSPDLKQDSESITSRTSTPGLKEVTEDTKDLTKVTAEMSSKVLIEKDIKLEAVGEQTPKDVHVESKLDDELKTDEIPPSYEDLEQMKTKVFDETQFQRPTVSSSLKTETETKEIAKAADIKISEKEIYTMKDEEDNIVKKEVELKSTIVPEKLEDICPPHDEIPQVRVKHEDIKIEQTTETKQEKVHIDKDDSLKTDPTVTLKCESIETAKEVIPIDKENGLTEKCVIATKELITKGVIADQIIHEKDNELKDKEPKPLAAATASEKEDATEKDIKDELSKEADKKEEEPKKVSDLDKPVVDMKEMGKSLPDKTAIVDKMTSKLDAVLQEVKQESGPQKEDIKDLEGELSKSVEHDEYIHSDRADDDDAKHERGIDELVYTQKEIGTKEMSQAKEITEQQKSDKEGESKDKDQSSKPAIKDSITSEQDEKLSKKREESIISNEIETIDSKLLEIDSKADDRAIDTSQKSKGKDIMQTSQDTKIPEKDDNQKVSKIISEDIEPVAKPAEEETIDSKKLEDIKQTSDIPTSFNVESTPPTSVKHGKDIEESTQDFTSVGIDLAPVDKTEQPIHKLEDITAVKEDASISQQITEASRTDPSDEKCKKDDVTSLTAKESPTGSQPHTILVQEESKLEDREMIIQTKKDIVIDTSTEILHIKESVEIDIIGKPVECCVDSAGDIKDDKLKEITLTASQTNILEEAVPRDEKHMEKQAAEDAVDTKIISEKKELPTTEQRVADSSGTKESSKDVTIQKTGMEEQPKVVQSDSQLTDLRSEIKQATKKDTNETSAEVVVKATAVKLESQDVVKVEEELSKETDTSEHLIDKKHIDSKAATDETEIIDTTKRVKKEVSTIDKTAPSVEEDISNVVEKATQIVEKHVATSDIAKDMQQVDRKSKTPSVDQEQDSKVSHTKQTELTTTIEQSYDVEKDGKSKVDKPSTEKESAKLEESKSVDEKVVDSTAKIVEDNSDSSKSSVIVDDIKTGDDKHDIHSAVEKSDTVTSIKTETSVVEKTVKDTITSKDLDIGKDILAKGIKDEVRVCIESGKDVSTKDATTESISSIASSSKELAKPEESSLSGKSTPDIADVERDKQIQETLTYEKHIPGSSTPPTVPVSPIVKDIQTDIKSDISPEMKMETSTVSTIKEQDIRSYTPGSDEYEHGISSTHSDISLSQMSRAPHLLEGDEARESDEDDILGSPTSVTSQIGHSPSSQYDFDDDKRLSKTDQMSVSFYGTLPGDTDDSGFKSGRFLDESDLDFEKAMQEHRQVRGEDLTGESSSYLYEITTAKHGGVVKEESGKKTDIMTSSFIGTELPVRSTTADTSKEKDPIGSWGKPLSLPSPAPPDNKGTPKKEKKLPPNVTAKNKLNDDKKRSESPSKYDKKQRKPGGPIYVDLTYVPHHGNSNYSYVDFFKRIRARYYVFSGIEPSKEVYNALLEAKQTWEDKELEVTIIPTYDTDVLGYWVAENEELLTKYKIDLSPSASRCTINLQDHETSCSAYRLEF